MNKKVQTPKTGVLVFRITFILSLLIVSKSSTELTFEKKILKFDTVAALPFLCVFVLFSEENQAYEWERGAQCLTYIEDLK